MPNVLECGNWVYWQDNPLSGGSQNSLNIGSHMMEKARKFAIERHGVQKYGDYPYSFHLDAVANIASEYGDEAITIAYLHDVVEDTQTTIDEIETEFGRLISQCVHVLTDEPGADRKERKAKTYAKMSKVSGELELALIVKAADRLANFRSCVAQNNIERLKTYIKEQQAFREAAYRPNLCDPLWKEIEALAAFGP